MNQANQLYTIAVAFKAILDGERPWTALGNFLNDWFDDAKDRRDLLVVDQLSFFPPTQENHRWAALCAASVEYLCTKYGVSCPAWVFDKSYILPEPWFYYPEESRRAKLLEKTPEAFKCRNIYCGDRMFLNKYELAEQYASVLHQFPRQRISSASLPS